MAKLVRSVYPTLQVIALLLVSVTAAYSEQRSSTSTKARSAPQQSKPAQAAPLSVYDQGYQKGYSDGFAQGQADWQQGVIRDYQGSDAYRRREQAYDSRLATSEEYIQGYELGFELGHTDGYLGRPRNPTVPANGIVIAKAASLASAQRAREQQSSRDYDSRRDTQPPPPHRQETTQSATAPALPVPAGTEMFIRLTSPIDTKNNRVGDRFTADVTTPEGYAGATIEGHIANINKSGRVSGRTELTLAFDTITLEDGKQAPITASLERIIESETVKRVDKEGRVESGSRTKDSQVRGGVGAAAGAVIGGIAGGAKGAILGAIIGGAAGVGTVYVEGNKDLVLEPGTDMVIRTERPRMR